MNTSDYLIEFLYKIEIDNVFGVSGAKIEKFFNSIYNSKRPISLITAKHEFSAASMADAYGRCGKKLGVVATTSGGASLNIIPALGEAFTSCSPLLAIVGQTENNRQLYGAFQETSGNNGTPDLFKVYEPVTRLCRKVQSESDLPRILREVYSLLVIEKTGPAVLMIPENLFHKTIDDPDLSFMDNIEQVEREEFFDCKELSTGKVLIIAGKGIARYKAEKELAALSEKLHCPVVTSPEGKDVFDNFSPYYLGTIGGMGNPSAFEAVCNADTLIVSGTNLNELTQYGLKDCLEDKKILYIGSLPIHVDKYIHVGTSIIKGLKHLSDTLEVQHFDFDNKIRYNNKKNNMYVQMLNIIENEIPSYSNIAIDAGVSGVYAVHNLRIKENSTCNIALGMGGVGYSFGSIIGSVAANKNKGYLIAGDGSFYMNGFEIHTALELNLPIVFIIFNNRGHKMCSVREALLFNDVSQCNDFSEVHLGRGLDELFPTLHSYDVSTPEALEETFKNTRMISSPVFISINIEDSDIPPYLPFNIMQEKK